MSVITDEKSLVDWYDNQERVLTPAFLETIPWHEVKNTELDPSFFPVLLYFRDVEKFTDVYFRQLAHTPTGRDKAVRQFMEKWRHEEVLHADLLSRFLVEAGYPSETEWIRQAMRSIPFWWRGRSKLSAFLANCVGTRFTAVHMTWGAINEMSTLTGYRRLWTLAKHPVLEYILRAIAKEEATHSFFYAGLAKLKLERSRFSQEMTRFIIDRFWSPVGQGAKRRSDTNVVIRKLFDGKEGIDMVDTFVNQRLESFPGFEGCKAVTKRIAETVGIQMERVA